MSEVRLNIIDSKNVLHGTLHGAIADIAVAALSAEPETIAELEYAMQRFIKPVDDHRPFASFHAGANEEAWDAGIVIVDLAARIVAAESSYSSPRAQGEIQYHDGTQATDVSLLYRVPDDWLFVDSVAEYQAHRAERLDQRSEPYLDAREVLYGPAMIEFLVLECAASGGGLDSSPSGNAESDSTIDSSLSDNPQSAIRNPQFVGPQSSSSFGVFAELGGFARNASDSQSEILNPQSVGPQSESPLAEIHARWLTAPRADLRGKTPREVILAKLDFIDFDLQYRAQQWSLLGEGPPPLPRDSFAYRFAGFGTHEYVVYYDLLRHLLSECWQRAQTEQRIEVAAESSRLNEAKEAWLNEPQPELDGRIPSAIIESERRRLPVVMSAKSMMIDENCDVCRMLAGETGEDLGPGFWHLDGCNMDEGFEFSTYRTREEWEEEQRKWREFNEEFNRKWAKKDRGNVGG